MLINGTARMPRAKMLEFYLPCKDKRLKVRTDEHLGFTFLPTRSPVRRTILEAEDTR
jgi:hypothetical protein